MSRARELSLLANANALTVNQSTLDVGIGNTVPNSNLDVGIGITMDGPSGVITATKFVGDGSGLDGVASSGIGTPLTTDTTKSLNRIYYTNQVLVIAEDTTVEPPAGAGGIAFSQAAEISVDSSQDLIVADGDSLILDVLGIGTTGSAAADSGSGGRVRADNYVNRAGTGGVTFPNGFDVTYTGVSTIAGSLSVGGTVTHEDVTNIDSVGIVTARAGVDITGGTLGLSVGTGATVFSPATNTLTLGTNSAERVRINASGYVGVNDTSGNARFIISGDSDTSDADCQLRIYDTDASAGSQIPSVSFFGGSTEIGRIRGTDNTGMRFYTANSGSLAERFRITQTGGLLLDNGELIEKCYINGTAWSTNGDINLDNGMIQYNTANLAGTNNTLNITSSIGINTSMSTGDIMAVTCLSTQNAATAYVNHITIDHAAVTENWVGGSAPTAGGGSGIDIYGFNIIKTGSAAYTVIANQVKTS